MTKPKLVWTAYEIFDAQFKGDLILLKDGYKKFLDADEVKKTIDCFWISINKPTNENCVSLPYMITRLHIMKKELGLK